MNHSNHKSGFVSINGIGLHDLDWDGNSPALIFLTGMGAILLGLPYILHAFGPTEAEVTTWGWISLCMGVSLIFLSMGIGRSTKGTARALLSLGYTALVLLQVAPILLWFTHHGSGISDGTPPGAFVAHWSYSLPHLGLVVVSLVALYRSKM